MKTYDGVIEKPELNDGTLAHFGLAKAVHKYIDKYMGKNGKWIYRYASTAKSAATGAINKAKTMLPGMQKKATSLGSKGTKIAGPQYSQARKRMSSLLPGLYRKRTTLSNGVRKTARRANQITRKTYSKAWKIFSTNKAAKTIRNKNLYQRAKRKVGEATGKYSRMSKLQSMKKNGKFVLINNSYSYNEDAAIPKTNHGNEQQDHRFGTGRKGKTKRPRSRRKNVTSGVGKVYRRKIR